MSQVIIEDGGRCTHDPSDSKVYTFDWDTNNLATSATVASSRFKLTTIKGTTLEKTVTSITRSSTTATATCTAHGYATGDYITIMGASPAGTASPSPYNGTFQITKIDADSFSYTVSGAPATPATIDPQVSAITAVAGFDNVDIASNSRSTSFRFTGGAVGAVYEIANLIVTNETPAQGKERHFFLLVENK